MEYDYIIVGGGSTGAFWPTGSAKIQRSACALSKPGAAGRLWTVGAGFSFGAKL